jgi:hypothetical protein
MTLEAYILDALRALTEVSRTDGELVDWAGDMADTITDMRGD